MKLSFRSVYVIAVAVAFGCFLVFAPDPAAAAGGLLLANAPLTAANFEALERAFREYGVKAHETFNELKNRLQDLEQKGKAAGGGGGGGAFGSAIAELAQLIVNSEQTKGFLNGHTPATQIKVPGALMKAAIVNATGQNQPLVSVDRRPGIVFGPQRRFTIRDLFPQVPTSSNLIEYTRETSYTNNAGPQYDSSSPTPHAEGAVKNESGMTFDLVTSPVITIAHWIPASRQVLADAPLLERYLDSRLIYGLKLEEEDELLNADGTAGQLNGLINQATGFTGGATNQSALDTLALSIAQLVIGDYMPSGFIINPRNWWSTELRLKKDTQGRYILGDPNEATEPRLWGLPVVITNTMPSGEFVTLDGPRAGYIADREDANVRISEHHADFFIRNMVALLAEERIGLVMERPAAVIHGSLTYAG